MKKYHHPEHGFTLIELLIVIFIIAILTGLAMTNFLGARERARDSKRKSEMMQLKTALRLYYNDYGKYPASGSYGIGYQNVVDGCGTDGTMRCNSANCNGFFAAGPPDGCATVYMKKFPSESGSKIFYFRTTDDQVYHLEVALENKADPDAATSMSRCPGAGGATCGNGEFCVCPD